MYCVHVKVIKKKKKEAMNLKEHMMGGVDIERDLSHCSIAVKRRRDLGNS